MGISINQLDITIMERYDYFAAVKEDVFKLYQRKQYSSNLRKPGRSGTRS